MSKNSIYDYLACKIAQVLGAVFSILPPRVYVSLGGFFGWLIFYLDTKHRNIVLRNIRFVFHQELSFGEIEKIAIRAFENFGRNLFEVFALKRINKRYLDKYLRIEGRHFIDEALSRKKGLIFVTLHLGNWEIANAACGLLYQPYNVIVKEQRHGRLNTLLDSFRRHFGVKTADIGSLKDIIRALENNEIVSIVSDHGAGLGDVSIEFFKRGALMPQGAVKLALKFKAPVIFAYIVRVKGAYHKVVLEPFSGFRDTNDKENDLAENLRAINKKFEGYIRAYPSQYLWSYKRWKHSKERAIAILSDAKAGHLRQSEAVAKIISGLGFVAQTEIIEVKFRAKFSRLFLWFFSAPIFGIYGLRRALTKECFDRIERSFFDIVISCGSAMSLVNIIICRQNKAKSVQILRPGLTAIKKFDLAIIPRHDHPPRHNNVVVTEGALNLIDAQYLKEQSEKLSESSLPAGRQALSANYIGFLAGGDTKDFCLSKEVMSVAIKQIKSAAEKLNADILVTTSRRTSSEIEGLLKDEFGNYPRCKLLVIANEKNIPYTIGGILGLASFVVVTAESISMVSEAASSGKYVVVIDACGIGRRHREFLVNLNKEGYIYLSKADNLGNIIEKIQREKPGIKTLNDKQAVAAKLAELL